MLLICRFDVNLFAYNLVIISNRRRRRRSGAQKRIFDRDRDWTIESATTTTSSGCCCWCNWRSTVILHKHWLPSASASEIVALIPVQCLHNFKHRDWRFTRQVLLTVFLSPSSYAAVGWSVDLSSTNKQVEEQGTGEIAADIRHRLHSLASAWQTLHACHRMQRLVGCTGLQIS